MTTIGDVVYVTFEDVLALYVGLFDVTGQAAMDALTRPDLLESALARPRHQANYGDADVVEQAACLGHGIAQNHAFVDGNKRIAAASVEAFFQLNKLTLTCSDDYLAAWIIALAQGMAMEIFALCLRPFVLGLDERSDLPDIAGS